MRPTRPSARALRLRAACVLIPALGLMGGCLGPERDVFAPACPRVEPLPGAGTLAIYRPGGGRDLTDVQIEGTVLNAPGVCKDGEKRGTVEATLRLQMRFQRGPAAPTRQANIPYFVGLARGQDILNKVVRVARVVFPPNVDVATITTDPLVLILPVGPDRSAAGYRDLGGLSENRATGQRLTRQVGAGAWYCGASARSRRP